MSGGTDRIKRLSLWEDEDSEEDAAPLRAGMVDRWGEDTVTDLEDVLMDESDHTGFNARGDVESSGSAATLQSDLLSLVRGGLLRYRGERFTFQRPGECPNAVLRGDPDIPVYADPEMLGSAAWIDVCMPTTDWIRLMLTPFTNAPARSLFFGLVPSSVERVREGLRVGDEIPRGGLEMERQRKSYGTYLVPTNQEGRNRGVAAFLEDRDRVLGRLIARD